MQLYLQQSEQAHARSTAGAKKNKAKQKHQITGCMGARAAQRMQAQGQINQGAHARAIDTKLQREGDLTITNKINAK